MDKSSFGVVKQSDLPESERRRMNPREMRHFTPATPQIENLPDFKSDEMRNLLKRLRAKERVNG